MIEPVVRTSRDGRRYVLVCGQMRYDGMSYPCVSLSDDFRLFFRPQIENWIAAYGVELRDNTARHGGAVSHEIHAYPEQDRHIGDLLDAASALLAAYAPVFRARDPIHPKLVRLSKYYHPDLGNRCLAFFPHGRALAPASPDRAEAISLLHERAREPFCIMEVKGIEMLRTRTMQDLVMARLTGAC